MQPQCHTYLERMGDAHSLLPIVWSEQSIPAAHRHPISLSACGYTHNLNVKIQISHHTADDTPLLVVLFAKYCHIWFYNIEELGNNLYRKALSVWPAAMSDTASKDVTTVDEK